MSGDPTAQNNGLKGSVSARQEQPQMHSSVNWERFGLSETCDFEQARASEEAVSYASSSGKVHVKELFEVDQELFTPLVVLSFRGAQLVASDTGLPMMWNFWHLKHISLIPFGKYIGTVSHGGSQPSLSEKEFFSGHGMIRSNSTETSSGILPLFGANMKVSAARLCVFTSCVINIIGVVIFLRAGWLVAYSGIGLSVLIILLAFTVALITLMSAVGISHKCDVSKGDVYFIITHVLGGKMGGTIGLLYCLGNSIATSLYCIGFAESFAETVNWNFSWAIRVVSMITLLVLVLIALMGVKWIIRFQLLLLLVLCVSMLDFIVGTLATEKPDDGFTGFSNRNFFGNLRPQFTSETTFFVVLGVFFPSAFGVLAGVSMSGDLKDPRSNIPEGSVASLGACGALYVLIVLFLGSTCTNQALRADYMIMEKVSLVGALFLCGLYVASLSSSLGGLVGPPKVFQCISQDDVLPALKPFAKTRGGTEEPLNATLLMAFISLLVLFVGNLNTVAPIVVMPFLTTYAVINYAYFAMEMSLNIKACKISRNKAPEKQSSYGTLHKNTVGNKLVSASKEHITFFDARNELCLDVTAHDSDRAPLLGRSVDGDEVDSLNQSHQPQPAAVELGNLVEEPVAAGYACEQEEAVRKRQYNRRQSSVQLPFVEEHAPMMYAMLCNRWASLFMSFLCVLLSFCINWVYALVNLCITLLLYILISHSRPGLPPGMSSDFIFTTWLVSPWSHQRRSRSAELVVIQSNTLPYGISMYQVTQQNTDYDHRDQKHHASPIMEGRQPYE